MTANIKLKESYEVESKYGSFFTGGNVEWLSKNILLCQKESSLQFLDLQSGSVTHSIGEGDESVEDTDTIHTFTSNAVCIVSVHKSGLLKLWRHDGALEKMWKSIHKGPVSRLCLDADNKLASGGSDGIVRIWDIKFQTCTHSLKGCQGVISVVAFHPNKEIVFAAGDDTKANVKQFAVVSVDHNIILHNLKTFECVKQFVGFSDEILDACFLGKTDEYLAVASNSADIKLYTVSNMNSRVFENDLDSNGPRAGESETTKMTSTNAQQTRPVSFVPTTVAGSTFSGPSVTHPTEMVSTNSQLTPSKVYTSTSTPADTVPTFGAPEPTVRASTDEFPTTLAPATAKPPGAYQSASCPEIVHGDNYTQAEFLDRLTHNCRYDKLTRPGGNVTGTFHDQLRGPVDVYVQIDISHIEAAENLQFKLHMLLQYRYRDPRLEYKNTSPDRSRIVGEDVLRSKIWVPHVLLEHERDSAIMGHDARDIYMSIDPNGEVTYSRRIKATLYCWMDLQKFPFDEQDCEIGLLSWTYNASELLLNWEAEEPVVVANQLHLTEYTLLGHWTESGIKPASRQTRGSFTGNYSCLTFKFHMKREMGYYMLDYFLPSIMLVCISWVSFWLQADASAPRITIGTSTMLSFITLATAQTRTLPKVSYIKASEIWFLGCTIFIFGSMVEFAFVNIIWRRKSNVELKKVNSKYILKSTFTPRLARKELLKESGGLHKSHSCSSLDHCDTNSTKAPQYNNYLTVHSFSGGMSLPRITTESVDDLITPDKSTETVCLSVPDSGGVQDGGQCPNQQHRAWTTMTPQEISQWIDKRSRLVFPCAFIVFNAFYWGFVYWL
ncbi:uncharacterized protein CBL_14615 [Carabus blaptoides fortunei]